MAVIKCVNCENEILDTEIVCPYCDYPVSDQKEESEREADAALNGETIRISLASQTEFENVSEAQTEAESEVAEPQIEETEIQADAQDTQKESEEALSDDLSDDQAKNEEHPDVKAEETGASTMKISKGDIHSDALRRSLEERKVKRELSENTNKKKDHKIVILTVTIIGIFVIIYLIINVFQNIVGEGLFEEEKESKKAKIEATSSAEMEELGFEIHSHTLTITDESIIMTDYQAGDEKPWKNHKKDITNLTIADGIETIGAHAFDDLKGLRHVTLAPSVSTIGESAFYACSDLEKFAFDSETSKLKSVGNYAFTDCDSLTSVTFGPGLKRIGEGVFKSCDNLEKVTIPDSTTEIGADAFLSCHKLVIVCSKDSYAYEYATQNGIKVELTDDEDGNEKEEITTPSSNETKPEQKPSEPSSKPTTSVPPQSEPAPKPVDPPANNETPQDTPSTPPPASEPSNEEKIASLMGKLSGAQTQEEIDNILAQIDALTN